VRPADRALFRVCGEGAARRWLAARREDFHLSIGPQEPARVVPVVEEHASVSTRRVETAEVEIRASTRERLERVEAPLVVETVDVQRVPRNVVVEAMPAVRTEGDTTVIPVVEEELVVAKRLVLREEVHVTRRRTERRYVAEVPVATREVVVERHAPGASGAGEPAAPAAHPPTTHHQET
jgi:stress response protein YsnF